MPALAPGQTGRLTASARSSGSPAHWIRAVPRLGFFVFALAAGCAPASTAALAAQADNAHHTAAFEWLVAHEPSALVLWHTDAAEVRAILPHATLAPAGPHPCAQAKAAHAALLLVASLYAAALRDRAEDCGFALFRDGGALVIAPR